MMRVPFHSLRTSFHPVHAIATFPAVFDAPVVSVEPLYDSIGLPYAYDLVLTDGFCVVMLGFVLLREIRRRLLLTNADKGDHDSYE